ncbi:flavin-containing monooxygenase [Oceanococcus atlanticus]|uniref:Flavin-containing monooxygenase n=1 Tax=Oceanococcus atlanticus TaxID=1317117 RepID=A0A1Y1SBS4_9GAMM|nr:NAD(P)-binding domain-containing protein [Oceanococcus atlanticus]ORE86068.1 flavin-containing monooxygenase [Oceanococcus atlanticus]
MYAVIGAGPMGLSMARNLAKYGLDFVGFEIHADVGGLWDIDSPTSTMYASAHLISSKRMTEFAEFPMDEDVATYPHHSQMRNYFQKYAQAFGLYDKYEFETEVVSVVRQGQGWLLTSRHQGVETQRQFDAVFLCNGTLHKPNRPTLPGTFSGEIMHSAEYKQADCFRDKRVLMVGCGNSGADITVDAVHAARSVDLSVRRGYYFLPKFLMGKPIDTFGGLIKLPRRAKQMLDAALIRAAVGKPSDYGLPDPDYRLYESHPVMNTLLLHHIGHGDVRVRGDIAQCEGQRVTFKNGEQGEYDLIVLATGYDLDYPFIDPAEINWQGAAPQLYLNAFHPQADDVFVMGMVEASGLGWEGRNKQAELAALYLRQLRDGAASAQRFKQLKQQRCGQRLDGGYAYLQLDRMAYYVNKQEYLDALNGHIAELKVDLASAVAA